VVPNHIHIMMSWKRNYSKCFCNFYWWLWIYSWYYIYWEWYKVLCTQIFSATHTNWYMHFYIWGVAYQSYNISFLKWTGYAKKLLNNDIFFSIYFWNAIIIIMERQSIDSLYSVTPDGFGACIFQYQQTRHIKSLLDVLNHSSCEI
jgi:hypothetical protein